VSFGFGGKLITFSEKTASTISLHKLNKNQELTNKMKSFIEKAEKENLNDLLTEKINYVQDKNINLMWVALKCYYNNDYNALFTALGYDKELLKQETYNYIGKKISKTTTTKTRDFTNLQEKSKANANQGKDDALSYFSELTSKAEQQQQSQKDLIAGVNVQKNTPQTINNSEKPNLITETISKNINWNQGSEKLIKQSLLTGDLESAVDVALKCGREAEALLIAVSSNNPELLNKTKAEYFSKNKDLFIRNIFSSIINKNFEALLDYNVIKEWKEYILYAKTYLNDPKFSSFAYSIAEKLSNTEEIYSAIVCFILGQNFGKCIELLHHKYLRDSEIISKTEKQFLLHNLFEEVIALKYILDSPQNTNEIFDNIMTDYSNLLIENNLFAEACRYINKIRNKTQKMVTIYDRIYGHCESSIRKLFPKLQPPYNIMTIKPKLPQAPSTQKNMHNANMQKAQGLNSQQNKGLWDNNVNEQNTNIPKKPFGMHAPNSNIPGKLNQNISPVNQNIANNMNSMNANNPPVNNINTQKNVVPPNRVVSRPNISKPNEELNQSTNYGNTNDFNTIGNTSNVSNMGNTNTIGQGPNRTMNRPVNPPIAKAPVLPKQPIGQMNANTYEENTNSYSNAGSSSQNIHGSGSMMGNARVNPPPLSNPPRTNIPTSNIFN